MQVKKAIKKEIDKIPENYLEEVLNFICFLETKVSFKNSDILMLSETSLKKDWLSEEEDKAWKDL